MSDGHPLVTTSWARQVGYPRTARDDGCARACLRGDIEAMFHPNLRTFGGPVTKRYSPVSNATLAKDPK